MHDARRHGATVLALDGAGADDLAGVAHRRLAVGTAEEEPFDLAQHLVGLAAGQRPDRRAAWHRLAALAGRLAAGPTVSRW
ncbi:hypothetical protein GCM10009639_35740 [Kitasatospora putterlickiae]|uniref:Uncharacterized protein n=1 Tax=Kitasatospora putterlickiae TaxID=221725 RepID=A0ABN1Y4N1_9ACTN